MAFTLASLNNPCVPSRRGNKSFADQIPKAPARAESLSASRRAKIECAFSPPLAFLSRHLLSFSLFLSEPPSSNNSPTVYCKYTHHTYKYAHKLESRPYLSIISRYDIYASLLANLRKQTYPSRST